MSAILRLENLSVSLPRGSSLKRRSDVAILDNLNLEVRAGEMLGLVGESGSGKTIAALSVMRLLPPGILVFGALIAASLTGQGLLARYGGTR